MSLAAGTRLGPYEILAPLGAGGMGEVYRARDPRLGREVAIKVLPERVAGDADALSRFEREARAVAGLSHPNILAIHDFGVEQGTAYSVTEMLEGETLRERLAGSPLPVRKTLEYAIQIAHGLSAAHDKGVVHRDLKPENIFITHDGRTKILDFGLAKVGLAAEGDLTASPTVDMGTRPGTVLGTMGYMSPEQVRGQAVDHRSDLFAFGSILYEMLSGNRAFSRETPADTMSAILKEDPQSLSAAPQEIPPALLRLVEHCLEKNPAERFQSARDLAFHLEAVGTVSSSTVAAMAPLAATGPRRGLRAAGLLMAGLAVGAVIGGFASLRIWSPAPFAPPTIRYISYSGKDRDPSASRDGRLIAYSAVHEGRSQIWLKQFPGGDEVALTTGPDDRAPRISPDGTQVLFDRTDGSDVSVWKIPVVGGEPRKIVDDAYEADWSPDGRLVAFLRDRRDGGSPVSIVGTADASGQQSREIAEVRLARINSVRWSADGKTLAVVKAGIENAPNTLLLVPADGGEIRTLVPPPPAGRLSSPVWVDGSRTLLYTQSETFVSGNNSNLGSNRVILQDVASGKAEIKMWLPLWAGVIDLLGPGRVVLGVASSRQNLREISLSGGEAEGAGHWLTRGNSTDRQPTFSPDGQWMLFSSNRGGNLDLWKMSVATGALRRLTEDLAEDWDPAFSPDGTRILWSSNRNGHFEIWTCAADGTEARQLTQDGFDAENPTMTSDGRWVVYNSANPAQSGIWKIHPDGTGATLIVAGAWSVPDVSPDGRYVAYRRGGQMRAVMIARVEDGDQVMSPIELPGGNTNGRVRWMPDGRRFLYLASDENGAQGIYVQDFVPNRDTTATRRVVVPFDLEQPPETFGVSPDGTRLVYSMTDTLESLMLAEGLTGIERGDGK